MGKDKKYDERSWASRVDYEMERERRIREYEDSGGGKGKPLFKINILPILKAIFRRRKKKKKE